MRSMLIVMAVLAYAADSSAARKLSLADAVRLIPGDTTKSRLVQLLGKPDKENIFKEPPTGESWEYKENGLERLSFFFEAGSDKAYSWIWGMDDKDPEKDLKVAKSLFPNATWNIETTKWINPHAFPYECFYKDEKLGVSLEFNLVRKEVARITRWNPDRKLASKDDDKPPTFCIGGACSPAIPASEFFKGSSVAKYCEEVH